MIELIAISALLAACGGLLLWDYAADSRRHMVALRLKTISEGTPGGAAGGSAASALPFLFRLGDFESYFEILGWRYADKKLIYLAGAFALIFAVQWFFFGILASLAAIVAALFATFFGIRALVRRKTSNFVDEFPDFVDRIRQLVIAGNSITTAFDKALRYCSPLQRRFLSPVATMVSHGAPLYDALHQRAVRLNVAELFLFTAIVRTNMRFGGDLSASLEHFETTLLNRVRAHKEFKAMTSELRMTTVILMALPLVAGVGIFLLNPHYLDFFTKAPQGRPAAIYVGISVLIGLYLVKKLTKVEY
jgi:tight adherence protein B